MKISSGEIRTLILSDEETFYKMASEIVDRILKEKKELQSQIWISESQVMALMHIKSKTTLATYRAKGYIAYSALGKRSFIYDKRSVLAFINSRIRKAYHYEK